MTIMKRVTAALAAVLVAIGMTVALHAQEVEGKARVGEVEGKAKIDLPGENNSDGEFKHTDTDPNHRLEYRGGFPDRMGKVGNMNKASKVIGTEVKNHHGELLGEIQDVVVDLPSGRVSYVVLSVGGFLGIGEKYIAVPPSAFQPDTRSDKLVLNVDKSKVQAAPGFVKTQWPDFENPEWGASAEWAKDPALDKPDDTSGSLRIDRDPKGGIQADTELRVKDGEYKAESEYKGNDRSYRRETSRADDNRYRATAADDTESYRGRIVSVNTHERTFTVTGEDGTRTFKLADKPTLTLRANRNPQLIDFRPGYSVAVGYHKEGEMWIAHSLIRTDPSESK